MNGFYEGEDPSYGNDFSDMTGNAYTLKEEPINEENTTIDGKTYKTIIVRWNRTPKEFDVTFDYDNGTENERMRQKI